MFLFAPVCHEGSGLHVWIHRVYDTCSHAGMLQIGFILGAAVEKASWKLLQAYLLAGVHPGSVDKVCLACARGTGMAPPQHGVSKRRLSTVPRQPRPSNSSYDPLLLNYHAYVTLLHYWVDMTLISRSLAQFDLYITRSSRMPWQGHGVGFRVQGAILGSSCKSHSWCSWALMVDAETLAAIQLNSHPKP